MKCLPRVMRVLLWNSKLSELLLEIPLPLPPPVKEPGTEMVGDEESARCSLSWRSYRKRVSLIAVGETICVSITWNECSVLDEFVASVGKVKVLMPPFSVSRRLTE